MSGNRCRLNNLRGASPVDPGPAHVTRLSRCAMKKSLLKRMIPDKDQIVAHPWMQRLGPRLLDPRLWVFSRRGVAIGAALGVFFGFLIPVAQIPFTAAMAVVMRANIPAAAAGTLITNPLTFAPIMISAHTILTYLVVMLVWRIRTTIAWRRRKKPPVAGD